MTNSRMNAGDLSEGQEQHKIFVKQSIIKFELPPYFHYLPFGYEFDQDDDEIIKIQSKVWPVCSCSNNCSTKACGCTKSSTQAPFRRLSEDSIRNDAFNPLYVGQMVTECRSDCRCLPIVCPNRMLCFLDEKRIWQVQKKVSVFKTKYCGWGLKAEQFCDVGEYIGPYVGRLVDSRYVDDEFISKADYCMNIIGTNFVIDAQDQGNALRFANHCCEPNMDQIQVVIENEFPLVCFYANQRILPGEELTFNYGPQYWKTVKDSNPAATCKCGSKQCAY